MDESLLEKEESLEVLIPKTIKVLLKHKDPKLREKGARLGLAYKRQSEPTQGSGELLNPTIRKILDLLFSLQSRASGMDLKELLGRMRICPCERICKTTDFELLEDEHEIEGG